MHEVFHQQVLPSKGVDNNVITIVIREYAAFSKKKLLNICLLNTNFVKMIPKLQRWLWIDFSLLCKPRLNYKSQMQIDPH